tara:strand:+ start:1025 stop:1594 length:570 start_codon:yes stop_codon:yes gene_type:complete
MENMSPFDFLAIVIAIPMGLALVEIAQGISTTLRRRHAIKVGLLTPLLSIYLLLIISNAWLSLWRAQEILSVERSTLFFGLLLSVIFYIAASFAVPDSPEDGSDLDDWFLANRKFSLGGTFLLVTLVEIYLGQRFTTWGEMDNTLKQIGYVIGFSLRPALILGVIVLPRRYALGVLVLLVVLEVLTLLT